MISVVCAFKFKVKIHEQEYCYLSKKILIFRNLAQSVLNVGHSNLENYWVSIKLKQYPVNKKDGNDLNYSLHC